MIEYQTRNSNKPYNFNAIWYHNYTYRANLHTDLELVYVKEGTLLLSVDGLEEEYNEGDFAMILPNQIHSFKTVEHSVIWIGVFAQDYVPEFMHLLGNRVCTNNRLFLNEYDRLFLLTYLIDAVPDYLGLFASLNFACAAFMKTRNDDDFTETYSSNTVLLHQILAYVSAHFKENITIREMAQSLGYEEHYLSRCFSTFFKKNFKQFVNEYRIQYARKLLAEHGDTMPITDIAYQSGFQSVRNFNRAYQSIVGISPREDKPPLPPLNKAIKAMISYVGSNAKEASDDFHGSLDDYLNLFDLTKEETKISFPINLSQDLYKRVVTCSLSQQLSLNSLVEEALQDYVKSHPKVKKESLKL